jgi:hypothetical protein
MHEDALHEELQSDGRMSREATPEEHFRKETPYASKTGSNRERTGKE